MVSTVWEGVSEAMGKVLVLFTADPEAAEIGALFERSGGMMVDAIAARIECGEKLLAKKGEQGHGCWLGWLKANRKVLGFGEDAAERMMRAARANSASTRKMTEAEALKLSRSMWGNAPKPKSRRSKSRRSKPPAEAEEERVELLHLCGAPMGLRIPKSEADKMIAANDARIAAARNRYLGFVRNNVFDLNAELEAVTEGFRQIAAEASDAPPVSDAPSEPPKRRGGPKGSKNKCKTCHGTGVAQGKNGLRWDCRDCDYHNKGGAEGGTRVS
jgi:hypothetical protein